MTNLIDKYNEFKETDDYKTFRASILEENPDAYLSSIELAVYGYWYETNWKTYCIENGIHYESLEELAKKEKQREKPPAEVKAIHSYTAEEFERYIETKEKIKGVQDINLEFEENKKKEVELPSLVTPEGN